MILSSKWSKLFAGASALLLTGVMLASSPSRALAGDDSQPCPGTRCTGRQLPLCCTLIYTVGPVETDTDFYYFPNAS